MARRTRGIILPEYILTLPMNNMRRLYKKTCIAGIILAVAIMFQQNIIVAATDRTVSVVGTATKPLTPDLLLDDFRYAAPVNLWSVSTGTFSSSSLVPPPANAICVATYISDSNAYSGYSLKLNYDVTAAASYAGYFSQMGGGSLTSLGTSSVTCTAISFYVKGAVGGEFFKVQLKNASTTLYTDPSTTYYRNSASVYITDYLTGGVTNGWQKVTIPFHAFANLDGFSSMKEFVIVFEGDQSRSNGIATPTGTIYIDNIQFETAAVTSVKVSSFGHKIGVNALGGSIGNFGDATYPANPSATYSIVNSAYTSAPYSMQTQYTVDPGFAGQAFIFGGGNSDDALGSVTHSDKMGWIAIPHNFTGFNSLKFSVRSLASGQNPVVLKIELVDNGGTRFARISSVTNSWQSWAIDLNTQFPDLNKTSIKQMNIVYEDWVISSFRGNKVGGIYIDDIRFE